MSKNNVTVLMLAGGFGTRLSKVVADVPKPLAPVCGKPFLYYILEKFIEQDVSDFIFLVHHKAGQIVEFIQNEQQDGLLEHCTVRFVEEDEPLGTGGAVANAVNELDLKEGFIVANADTWLSTGVAELTESAKPAIAVLKVEDTARYGRVAVENGRVVAFEEKRPDSGSGLINAGLYYLSPEFFKNWDGKSFSIETGLFPGLVDKGILGAVEINAEFTDIGVPEDYYIFCTQVEKAIK